MQYKPTIGLEVHAELATESKMFCGCMNAPHGSEPNANVCPVCLAHPGTLPVANESAIEMVLRFGEAVGALKATYSEFDRKNYFYPDIPKAYQISQYKFPFLTGGELFGVMLTRVHLEEDTARSSHELTDGSLVDFNRAGVPLMELVTEPVIHDSKVAGAFARELQLLLQTLGISDANMERGEMRIEANISVSADPEKMSTRYVEVKNINSFKAVEAAIEYEIVRQIELLESGGELVQETRGWDENQARTFSQRTKESAKDYRYFPDPDLPKLQIDKIPNFSSKVLAEKIPLLPEKKREIYSKFSISREIIESIISDKQLDSFFKQVFEYSDKLSEDRRSIIKLAANYVAVDIASLLSKADYKLESVDPVLFLDLMTFVHENKIGSRNAKDFLPKLQGVTGSMEHIATEQGLLQKSDETTLKSLAEQVIEGNPEQVAEYKAGKEALLKYLVGQGMKLSKGAANPQVFEKVLIAEITK